MRLVDDDQATQGNVFTTASDDDDCTASSSGNIRHLRASSQID